MSNSQPVTILASIGDTLNFIDAVKDNWTSHTLPASEKWALNNWCNGARAAIYNYMLLLDNSELRKQNKSTRLHLNSGNGSDTFYSAGEIDIHKKGRFPRRPHGRVTSCLQGIMNGCETGQYENPSALPMLMDDNGKVEEMFKRHGVHRSPSLAFLAVDFYLDWIGIELFKWHSRAKGITYWHYTFSASDMADYLEHGEWKTLRDEIVKALYPWWSSNETEFSEKHRIVMDLERLHAKVGRGSAKSPFELKEYIEDSLKLTEMHETHIYFQKEMRELLLASPFFRGEPGVAPIRHSHAEASSTGTSQSLGCISNKFVPQARSLPSHRF